MKRLILAIGSAALACGLAACQSSGPLRQITRGDELYFNDFSQSASFEEGSYDGATLRVRDGAYRIDVTTGDGTLWWGQYGETLGDAIIDVDATQMSERPETVYGVMCRVRGTVGQPQTPDPELTAILTDTPATEEATAEATPEAEATEPAEEATAEVEPAYSPSGDGYLFVVQGSGQYAIFRARGRDVQTLVNWTASEHIRTGAASNHLRAVCVDNYLAFYINDQFVADTTDDSFRAGQIGLVAGAASRLGARIEFDNLSAAAPAS